MYIRKWIIQYVYS